MSLVLNAESGHNGNVQEHLAIIIDFIPAVLAKLSGAQIDHAAGGAIGYGWGPQKCARVGPGGQHEPGHLAVVVDAKSLAKLIVGIERAKIGDGVYALRRGYTGEHEDQYIQSQTHTQLPADEVSQSDLL